MSRRISTVTSANAGLDYSPYSDGAWTQATLSEGIANGSLAQARFDDLTIRSMLPYYFVGLDTANQPSASSNYSAYRNVRRNHSTLLRQVRGEAIALLRNNATNGGGLPLKKPHSISIYGAHVGPAMASKSSLSNKHKRNNL